MKKLALFLGLLLTTNIAFAGEPEIARLKANGMSLGLANEVDDIYYSSGDTVSLTSPTISGNLTFSTAAAKIIPGATSLTFRNNADSASNLSITDAGAIGIRGSVTSTVTGASNNFDMFANAINVRIFADAAGAGGIGLLSNHPLRFITNNALRWSMDTSGNSTQDATNGGDIVINKTNSSIRAGTADAADNVRMYIASGGSAASTRGGFLTLAGNESAGTGNVALTSGNISGAEVELNAAGASGIVRLIVGGGTKWYTNSTGEWIGAGTSSIGWTVQSAANQACNTTCVTPCVFGQETTSKAILACTDATADSCLCAGAS